MGEHVRRRAQHRDDQEHPRREQLLDQRQQHDHGQHADGQEAGAARLGDTPSSGQHAPPSSTISTRMTTSSEQPGAAAGLGAATASQPRSETQVSAAPTQPDHQAGDQGRDASRGSVGRARPGLPSRRLRWPGVVGPSTGARPRPTVVGAVDGLPPASAARRVVEALRSARTSALRARVRGGSGSGFGVSGAALGRAAGRCSRAGGSVRSAVDGVSERPLLPVPPAPAGAGSVDGSSSLAVSSDRSDRPAACHPWVAVCQTEPPAPVERDGGVRGLSGPWTQRKVRWAMTVDSGATQKADHAAGPLS